MLLLLDFRGSKYLFQLNLVCIGDRRIGFCPGILWKHELNLRSGHCSSSIKRGVLGNFVNFTERHLYWSLFLIGLQAKRLKHRWFTVEFTKFLKTEVYERLLLKRIASSGVSFLISYTCGSNWFIVFVSIIIYSFACQFSLHYWFYCDTAIITSSRLVVFSKKRCSYKLCKICKKTPALESRF